MQKKLIEKESSLSFSNKAKEEKKAVNGVSEDAEEVDFEEEEKKALEESENTKRFEEALEKKLS